MSTTRQSFAGDEERDESHDSKGYQGQKDRQCRVSQTDKAIFGKANAIVEVAAVGGAEEPYKQTR